MLRRVSRPGETRTLPTTAWANLYGLPLRRLFALDRMIRSGEYPNAHTAARALEVHPRTIYRDRDGTKCPASHVPLVSGTKRAYHGA